MPLDLVYLWVDGGHPKSQSYRRQHGVSSPFQVSNHNELLYSLRSVHLHAPWVRRIVVVSECGIVPPWSAAFPAVEWVDQDTVLPPEAVPCFNNMVLEAYLHRLPGLTEPFLYMNDDFFLGQDVTPELWTAPWTFYRSHAIVPTAAQPQKEWLHMTVRTADLCQQRWGNRPALLQHVPYLVSGRAMESVLSAFPAVGVMSARRSKRHAEDVVPLLLMQEWVRHEMPEQASRIMTAQKKTTPSYFFANVQVPHHQQALRQAVERPYHFITLNDSFGSNGAVTTALQGALEQLWPRISAPEAGRDFASLAQALAWVRQQPGPSWLQLGLRTAMPLTQAKALIPSSLQWEAVAIPPVVPRGSRLQRVSSMPGGISLLCLQPHVQLRRLSDLQRMALYQPALPRRRDPGFGLA